MEYMGVGKKILEHSWVPKHVVMKEDKVKQLLERLGIKKNQLPKMLDSDPVAMLLGARPGDVLEITRVRETSGENKYYRVVVRSLRD
ncbi:MAG: DNA-directed RNA polymerase subunit H [Candidatus Altiarchaeota archaeon]|nr:DNA-directed RNA polymerase subunit H [Candidatus Altiarchaeota archaeon]